MILIPTENLPKRCILVTVDYAKNQMLETRVATCNLTFLTLVYLLVNTVTYTDLHFQF